MVKFELDDKKNRHRSGGDFGVAVRNVSEMTRRR